MKGPFLSTLLLTLALAASAQVQPDSLQHKIASTLNKIDVDSIDNRLAQLPDSLLPAYHKIDSIRTGFNERLDSLQAEYQNALSKIDDRTKKINNRIDSLSHLNISTSRYTKSLDSLNQLRQKIEQKFTSRLNELKAKTTDKLKELDLPAEYKQPIQELTSKIDGLNLNTGNLKIPELDIPGFSIPHLDPLDKLGDRVGGRNPLGEQAGAYQKDIKNIAGSTGSPTDLPESIEAQASKIDGMDELKKQSGIINADKARLAELNDPAKAKEKALEMAKKTAVDHFAGKQEQLKAAMDKISKYKQKYSSVSSIKDLPKRPPNPMKAKPFVERLVPGLYLQYQRKNFYLADFNPYVGYRISGRFTSGLGWNHRYAYDKKSKQFSSRSVIFGPRAYVDFRLGKGFIAHIEGESMNTFVPSTLVGNPDTGEREWVWSFMTGIKKEYRIYKNLKGTALIQYNLFNRYYKAPYVDRLNSRIGFEYVIKARKKKPIPK
jgi:Skp family chaperone for outer membrane proteins